MGTTADKLLYLQDTKSAIKDAIESKGVTVPTETRFRDYATKILDISGVGETPSEVIQWVRDSNWLTLPDNVNGVQKVSILNAVFNTDSEYVAFTCSGDYTVNWGDGVTENFTSGINAEHKYNYSNVNLDSSKSEYKQCIITITPQSGFNLTSVLLCEPSSVLGSNTTYKSVCNFLEIKVNSLLMTVFKINYSIGGTAYYVTPLLESVYIGEHSIIRMDSMFKECYSLDNVVLSTTSGIVLYNEAFRNCYSLQSMPNLVLDVPCSLNSTFYGCRSLVEIPDLSLALNAANSLSNTFAYCRSIGKINITITSSINFSLTGIFTECSRLREFNLTLVGSGNITNLSASFQNCFSLHVAPELPTSICTDFSLMFNSCYSLVKVPEYNYSSATTLNSMFASCSSLAEVPNFNTTTSLTNIGSMFSSCTNLIYGATFTTTTNVNTISSLYNGCSALVSLPSYSFPSVNTASGSVFAGTSSLVSIPSIGLGNPTSAANILSGNYSLRRMLMPLKYGFNISNSKMSGSALNEMYSILPTVTGQTVTVTGNYGATNTPVVSLTKSFNEGSKIVAMTDTTNLSVGMFVAGNGTTLTTGKSCNITDSGNLVTSTGHSLIDGDIVSFKTLNGPTGIVVKTIYYVVNATTNTFQLSLTQGGSVIGLVAGAGSNGIYNSPSFITAITTNVSIEVSLPMVSTGTTPLAFRSNDHKTYLATMKGWTVTG